jgi:hypothetical protein
MKLDSAWWARCAQLGISAGLDWRNCWECTSEIPATLAMEVEEEVADVAA